MQSYYMWLLSIFMHFIPRPCLCCCLYSITMLNGSGENHHPCFVPGLKRMLLTRHHFFFFFLVFIYLAATGFSCRTQDPQSLLWHARSLVASGTFSWGMWDLVPDQGWNSGPLHWEWVVLASEPRGNTCTTGSAVCRFPHQVKEFPV